MLRGEPPTGRPDEGTARRDDWTESEGHQGLVPEQTMQGQEEEHPHEADSAAATGEGQCACVYFVFCVCLCVCMHVYNSEELIFCRKQHGVSRVLPWFEKLGMSWFENWGGPSMETRGVVGPGLKTGSAVNPGFKTGVSWSSKFSRQRRIVSGLRPEGMNLYKLIFYL